MKMAKKAIILLLTLGIVIQAFPQQRKIIRGRIIDKGDKIAVIGANVIEYDKENRIINGTISNVNGDFVLEMRSSENIIKISVIGYNTTEIDINVAGPMTIELEPLWIIGGAEDDVLLGTIERVLTLDDGRVFLLDSQLSHVSHRLMDTDETPTAAPNLDMI